MIISLGEDGALVLNDDENFKQFKVVVPATVHEANAVEQHLGGLGAMDEDRKHVWISIAAFLARFGSDRSPLWRESFNRMVESVAKYGYLSPDGTAVRSHIETA